MVLLQDSRACCASMFRKTCRYILILKLSSKTYHIKQYAKNQDSQNGGPKRTGRPPGSDLGV